MKRALIFMVLIAVSCSQKEAKTESSVEMNQVEVIELDNPTLFMGSSFGQFLQMLHKTGDYNQMLKFTSKGTRERFSDNTLLHFYRSLQFSYPLKLRAKNENNGQITLFYKSNIGATDRTIKVVVIVENDTCKLVLNHLDLKKPFEGF